MKCFIISILLSASGFMAMAEIETYNYPGEAMSSTRFTVKVENQPVYVLHSPIPASYAAFGTSGKARITIQTTTDVKWVDVRPKSLNIKPVIQNNIISFSIPGPCLLSIEINGSISNPLFIFANPIEQKPLKNDPDIIYFEAGKVHKAGTIYPKSHQTIYIEGGAVVEGAISAKNVEHVKVAGYGILDGTNNNQLTNAEMAAIFNVQGGYEAPGKYQRFIEFIDSKQISIEGLILHNSTTWQVVPINCDGVKITNLKLVSDNPSDDGIDIVRSRDVAVSKCFVRVKDDCVAIKAHLDYPPDVNTENVRVSECVFWNAAWGNGIEIGFELHSDVVRNITFINIDIIHVESGAVISIHNSDRGTVSDVLYEDIRVEDAYQKLFDLGIFRSKYCTDGSNDPAEISLLQYPGVWDGALLVADDMREHHSQFRGHIKNIVFRNIQIVDGLFPFSVFAGYDALHLVENISIENLTVHGKRITSISDARFFQEHTRNISLH
ncbi:MAG: hypothetical protein HC819_19885 [Cyclobacteriaceae bacterium]|nr:hypothetical protein [Cyclobacteriaceae bacterium]